MSGSRIDAAEFQDRDPGARELTIAMIDGEPVVLLWQARWVDAALSAAADMGLPVASSWGVARELGFEPGDDVGSAELDYQDEFGFHPDE